MAGVKWLSGLERRDKMLLTACLGMVALMILLLAVFTPDSDDRDPTPSSYATGSHGAKAGYLLLEHSGYRVERWTLPLQELNQTLNFDTANSFAGNKNVTLILADPSIMNIKHAQKFVQQFLEHGGRVLATGLSGGLLLPESHAGVDPVLLEPECDTTATGFDVLADSGKVRMRPAAIWTQADPLQRVAYLCDSKPVVVTYPVGKGQVIWWADSLLLENAGITRADNVALFLNSIGPAGTHVVWDESLHLGSGDSIWSYASGTPLHLLWWQLALVAVLLLLSYGRRSGPLRPDPVLPRGLFPRVRPFAGFALSSRGRYKYGGYNCLSAISPLGGKTGGRPCNPERLPGLRFDRRKISLRREEFASRPHSCGRCSLRRNFHGEKSVGFSAGSKRSSTARANFWSIGRQQWMKQRCRWR